MVETEKKGLNENIDTLTEENQRYFLGVPEALTFAQAEKDKAWKTREENQSEPHICSSQSGLNVVGSIRRTL